MNKKLVSLILLCVLLFSSVSAARPTSEEVEKAVDKPIGTDTAVITVDDANVLRTIDKNLLGTAIVNQSGYYDRFVVPGTSEITYDGKKIMQEVFKMPCVRLTVGVEVLKSIGPQAQRQSSTYQSMYNGLPSEYNYPPLIFGTIEAIKMTQENNKDITYVFIIPIDDKPENIVQFAHFLTDESDESEYGLLRTQYGVKDPVKVIFELGNERDGATGWKYNEAQTDWYMERARAIIDALKADEGLDIPIMACGKTAMWNDRDGTVLWTRRLAEELGEDIDYISMHPYYSGNEMPIVEDYMKLEMDTLNEVLGEGHGIKLFITEHAKWPRNTSAPEELHTLESILATSAFLNRTYANTFVAGANYHTFFHNVGSAYWSMIDLDDTEWMYHGILKLYDLYEKNIGDRVFAVSSEFSSERQDFSSVECRTTVLATASGKNKLILFLTNRSQEYDADLTFKFSNKYKLVNEKIFTAPNLKSWVYRKEAEDLFTITDTDKNESNFTSYKVPVKSMAVLTLEASNPLPSAEGDEDLLVEETDISKTETDFVDLEGVWAKGEIAQLKLLGFVNGVSQTEFKPFDNITRAQFSAMLAKVMGYPTDYPAFFDDVNSDSWYAPYANAVYYEGVMTGNGNRIFNPDSFITLEEAVVSVMRAARLSGAVVSSDNSNIAANFKNLDGVSDWAKDEIYNAAAAGILSKLYENGNLIANAPANRAEAASILYRLYKLSN